jgi:hypothetical protein
MRYPLKKKQLFYKAILLFLILENSLNQFLFPLL